MRLLKLESKVLARALDSNKFLALRSYLDGFIREETFFISTVSMDNGKLTSDLRLALIDYCFNEQRESQELFALAKEITGKENIDLNLINAVDL